MDRIFRRRDTSPPSCPHLAEHSEQPPSGRYHRDPLCTVVAARPEGVLIEAMRKCSVRASERTGENREETMEASRIELVTDDSAWRAEDALPREQWTACLTRGMRIGGAAW